MPNYAANPGLYGGMPTGWTAQNAAGAGGGGNQSLVTGGGPVSTTAPDPNGFLSQSFSIEDSSFSPASTVQAGTLYLSKMSVRDPAVTVNGWVNVTTAASSPTHGWLVLLDGKGNLVAETADLGATAFVTTGPQAIAWAAPGAIEGGWYFAAVLMVGGTGLKLACPDAGASAVFNVDTTAASGNLRFSTAGTGLSALPTFPLSYAALMAPDSLIQAWAALS